MGAFSPRWVRGIWFAVFATSGCTSTQSDDDLASTFLNAELGYYESNARVIGDGDSVYGTLRYGATFPHFRAQLEYVLSGTPENELWMVMLGFGENTQSYSIHHWYAVPDTGRWSGVAVSSFKDANLEFVDLDGEKVAVFMNEFMTENCFDMSSKFELHGRVYYLAVRNSPDTVRRFVVREPGRPGSALSGPMTYRTLGGDSDRSAKSGTIIFRSDWEKGECYDTLSGYVEFVEGVFSEAGKDR